MSNYDEVVDRWIDIVLGKTSKAPLRNERMPVRGDMIYSYGSHFEMARAIRGAAGETVMFLINGDVWGPTTSGHQSHVRSGIGSTRLPSVIIPYQALNAAGIDRNDVRIVEVTSDTHEEIEHVYVDEMPPGCTLYWDEIRGDWELERHEIEPLVAKDNAKALKGWEDDLSFLRRYYLGKGESIPSYRWNEWLSKAPAPLSYEQWYAEEQRKDYWSSRIIDRRRVIGHQLKCGRKNSWRLTYEITYLANGSTQYRRTTTRHWLGEALIEARIAYPITRTCKWCKGSGRAEGPVKADWVPPEPIMKTVRFDERPYWRYVDTLQVKPGYFEEYPPPRCSACQGRGRWRESRHRTAKYLSGFDRNESRRSYFLCELQPGSTATTVAEAYESLKPEAVKIAEEQGRKVARQGDIFAVRLSPATTKRSLRRMGARFERRGQLFGTNHVATEVAYLPDGNTVVRGVLHHVPRGRGPDHARVRLDEGWHLVQKNTVPIAA